MIPRCAERGHVRVCAVDGCQQILCQPSACSVRAYALRYTGYISDAAHCYWYFPRFISCHNTLRDIKLSGRKAECAPDHKTDRAPSAHQPRAKILCAGGTSSSSATGTAAQAQGEPRRTCYMLRSSRRTLSRLPTVRTGARGAAPGESRDYTYTERLDAGRGQRTGGTADM